MRKSLYTAVAAALLVTGGSVLVGVGAETITSHTDGRSIGLNLWGKVQHYEDDLVVDVSGKGVSGDRYHNNVTGIYALDGTQVTIDKNVTVTVKNPAPAESGAKKRPDLAHYYMSGIYAGYGGLTGDGDNDDTRILIKGNAYVDAVGVGLQANKDGYIRVLGGADVKTYPLDSSDTYSVLSEEGFVYVNSGMDGLTPGKNDVKLYGNVGFINKNYGIDINPHNHGSDISLALTTPNSYLTGGVLNEFEESSNNPYHGGLRMYLQNGASWQNEWLGAERVYPTQGRPDNANYLYTGSKVEHLIGGADESSRGILYPVDYRPVTVNSFEGHLLADYRKGAAASKEGRGDLIINHAAPGSAITMKMNSDDAGQTGGNNPDYRSRLNSVAQKLVYTGYTTGERNLNATVQVDSGILTPAVRAELGTEGFDANGRGHVSESTKVTTDESTLVSGAKSAMLSSAMLMRADTNDLQRRLGDIRINPSKRGVWGKYIGGKMKSDEGSYVSQTYHMAQIGYDTSRNGWLLGGAFLYGTSSSDYAQGSGKGKTAGLALYGAKQFNDGRYADVILKANRLKNEFDLYNAGGNTLSGDYRNWGTSLSLEFGKRIKKQNGFYIDPGVEFTFSRLSAKDYDARTNGGGTVHIQQDAINSAVGRIGIGIGKESANSNVFAKLALAHEFSGNAKAFYSMAGEPSARSESDLKDTWLDLEVGGSRSIGANTYIYGTLTKNFGAKIENTYRVDAGIRHSF